MGITATWLVEDPLPNRLAAAPHISSDSRKLYVTKFSAKTL